MVRQLEQLVLEHINVYGMTIPQALMSVFELSEADANECLEDLGQKNLVKSALLTPTTDYFYLQGPELAKLSYGAICGRWDAKWWI